MNRCRVTWMVGLGGALLAASGLSAGCHRLRVPDPAGLELPEAEPVRLEPTPGAPGVRALRYAEQRPYATSLHAQVQPAGGEPFALDATARSRVMRQPDGSLSWRFEEVRGTVHRGGNDRPLGAQRAARLFAAYPVGDPVLAVPPGAVAGKPWSRREPIARVEATGLAVEGERDVTVTYLGRDAREREVFRVETRTRLQATGGSDGHEGDIVMAVSRRARSTVWADASGTIVREVFDRIEVTRMPAGETKLREHWVHEIQGEAHSAP